MYCHTNCPTPPIFNSKAHAGLFYLNVWLKPFRLFQEERPVWHTINCNVLHKDQTAKRPEEEKFEDKQIIMVTEDEGSVADDMEG